MYNINNSKFVVNQTKLSINHKMLYIDKPAFFICDSGMLTKVHTSCDGERKKKDIILS